MTQMSGPPSAVRPSVLAATVASGLIGLTAVLSIVHVVLVWQAEADRQKIRSAPDPVQARVDLPERAISGGHALAALTLMMVIAAVAFLVWLWQARRVAELTNPAAPHRHSADWLMSSWFCPVLQFWYPLQALTDIDRAGVAPDERDRGKGLRLLWWVSWAGHWALVWMVCAGILLSGTGLMSSPPSTGDLEADTENIVDRLDQSLLLIKLGITVLSVLLTSAAVLGSVLILRITNQQAKLAPVRTW